MKTMTCAQMGGPCDTAMSVETKEEMMEKGTQHLKSSTDEAHQKILAGMASMTPEDNAKWQKTFDEKWEAAPEA